MTRLEMRTIFRAECPEITSNVVSDTILNTWALTADKEVSARARLIVDDESWAATADVSEYDLTQRIDNFYDIDEFPGGGVIFDGKRLKKLSMAELDKKRPNWRSAESGVPVDYFRRGKYLYLGTPPEEADTIQVYCVKISEDFDQDSVAPFNELTHLEPFHYSIVLYMIMRAKAKVGKPEDAAKARAEYESFIAWIKKEIGGGKYGIMSYTPPRRQAHSW